MNLAPPPPTPIGSPLDRRAYPAGAIIDHWVAEDGWPLRRFRLSPQGRAWRGSLLFMGGRGDMIEKYLEAIIDWVRRGWAVTALDWRGQGGSGRLATDPRVGHAEDFAPWIADLAAYGRPWLAEGGGPRVLIGHSMGGHLVLRAMAEGVIHADAAVLIAPMLGLNSGLVPGWLAACAARFMAAIGDPARAAWKQNEKPASPASMREQFLTHSPERYMDELWWRDHAPDLVLGPPSWKWLVEAYRSTAILNGGPLLATMNVPTLILGTSVDHLVSPAAIHRVAARLPDCRLHMYGAEAAHEILREADSVRNDALARIDAFLDERAPAR